MTGKTKTKKTETKDLVTPYEPTPYERAAMVAYVARKKEKPLAPRMKVSDEGRRGNNLTGSSRSWNWARSSHGGDWNNGTGLRRRASRSNSPMPEHKAASVDERGLNFMLAMVKGMEPKDQVEAMLAAQMAAVHMSTMTFARRLAHVENIPQQDSAERAFNKLARTFAAQVGGAQAIPERRRANRPRGARHGE